MKQCNYREDACVWHRRCHCLRRTRGFGSENTPFCTDLLRKGKCPEGRDRVPLGTEVRMKNGNLVG